eukprot:2803977-Rhodomonas_salina.4
MASRAKIGMAYARTGQWRAGWQQQSRRQYRTAHRGLVGGYPHVFGVRRDRRQRLLKCVAASEVALDHLQACIAEIKVSVPVSIIEKRGG